MAWQEKGREQAPVQSPGKCTSHPEVSPQYAFPFQTVPCTNCRCLHENFIDRILSGNRLHACDRGWHCELRCVILQHTMPLIHHSTGCYRFLPGIAPYSCGVVSSPGYEIV